MTEDDGQLARIWEGIKDTAKGAVRGVAAMPAEGMGALNAVANWTPTRDEYAARYAGMGDRARAYADALMGGSPESSAMGTFGEMLGPPVKGGVKALGVLGAVTPSLIKDWRWRKAADVQKGLGINEVPAYIQQGYGKFMQGQAGRAASGELGSDDLVKAYGITRSSVNRAARNVSDDLAKGSVRPEGYMSEWLLSPAGRDYRAAAQEGVADPAAIDDIVRRFQTFGMADTLGKDLTYGAKELGPRANALREAVTGDKTAWRGFAQDLPGIGPAKSGFLASLLGRGDLPTLDARQLNLWTGSPGDVVSKFTRRGGGLGGDQAVDRLASRQAQLALALDPSLAPQYQHLAHHTLWDKVGGTQTTHDDLIRAMMEPLGAR
jgi:hypothetical protein